MLTTEIEAKLCFDTEWVVRRYSYLYIHIFEEFRSLLLFRFAINIPPNKMTSKIEVFVRVHARVLVFKLWTVVLVWLINILGRM